MQRKKLLFIAAAILVVIVLIVALSVKHITKPAPNVIIKLAPSAATMKLDGKTTKAGSYNLKFGRHHLTASFKGFDSYSKDFYVKGAAPITILVALSPNSDEGRNYLTSHPSEQYLLESLSGQQFTQTGQQVASQNPIIQVLPYIAADNSYRIDYGSGNADANDLTQTIYITAVDDTASQAALDWISGQGYDTSTLNIVKITEPLLDVIPHTDFDFDLDGNFISGTDNRPTLTLTATLHLSDGDQSDRYDAINRYKQEVQNFIQSNGGNPSSYNITYNIVNN